MLADREEHAEREEHADKMEVSNGLRCHISGLN